MCFVLVPDGHSRRMYVDMHSEPRPWPCDNFNAPGSPSRMNVRTGDDCDHVAPYVPIGSSTPRITQQQFFTRTAYHKDREEHRRREPYSRAQGLSLLSRSRYRPERKGHGSQLWLLQRGHQIRLHVHFTA